MRTNFKALKNIVAQRVPLLVRWGLPLANMSIRAGGLVARFGLTIFLARYFDTKTIGAFGVVTGLAGLAPAIIGLGVNYTMNREIVGQSLNDAGRIVRDRMALTACSALLFSPIFAFTVLPAVMAVPEKLLVAAIVILEALAMDVHLSLISLGRPISANVLLFVRTASWVLPCALLGVLVAACRNLETILLFWLAGLFGYYLLLIPICRDFPLKRIARSQVDVAWILRRVRGGWMICLNDVGIASQLYLDRFVVVGLLGLSLTGTYTLYWTMANAVHVLVTTAVIQLALPTLVASFRAGGSAGLFPVLRRELKKLAGVAALLCVVMLGTVTVLLPEMGLSRFGASPILFALMCVGTFIRLVSDMISYGLYASGKDVSFAVINISGIAVSACASALLICLFGLNGAGLAMIATPTILLSIRLWRLFGRSPAVRYAAQLS